jgi:ADP-ribose pyrophosphatase
MWSHLTNERPFTVLSSHVVWDSPWYRLRQDQIRTRDGRELTYTIIDKPPAIWIVPVLADGRLVLINQYRHTVGEWCLEIPAGSSEPAEDPASVAVRELREEIGGTAQQFIPVAEFYLSTGITNGLAKVFLALGVTLGEAMPEDTEYITLHPVTVDEAIRMARSGAIKAGPSALALLLSEPAIRAYLREQGT